MNRVSVPICVITTVSLTLKTFLTDQLVYLSQNGFDVTVICDDDPDFAATCPAELHYIPVKMTRSLGILSTFMALIRIYAIFRRKRFAMIQYSTPKAALVSALSGFAARVPVRLYCQWGIRYVGYEGLGRRIFKAFERLTCSLSTHISPDSLSNQQFAISESLYQPAKTSVVLHGSANGVDLSKFDIASKARARDKCRSALSIGPDDFVFGFLGRIHRDKGITEMVEAFEELARENPDIHLILVGGWEAEHHLAWATVDLINGHGRIHAVGFQEKPQDYIAAFDVMVFPSYREGFGLVAIEAEALAVPVIAFDIPGPRDAIMNGETGYLVPLKDTPALKTAMNRFLADPDLIASMGRQGVAFVAENFEQRRFWQAVLEHRRGLVAAAGVGGKGRSHA